MNFNIVKRAETGGGWGIALLENLNWQTGERVHYSVVRFNAQGHFITLSTHPSMAKASSAANREWCSDRSALGKGI